MAKKEYKGGGTKTSKAEELLLPYKNSRIKISSIENQDEILLLHSLKQSPEERLKTMRLLIDYAYKNRKKKFNFKNARIIPGSYEYIPG